MLAIYCRISKDEQLGENTNRSINNQKDLGKRKADKLGMEYKFYTDKNLSGTLTKIEDRPQFSAMLDDVVSGKINAIFSTEQDRLERNPQVRHIFKQTLNEYNIRLFTSSEEIDLNRTLQARKKQVQKNQLYL